MNDHDALLCAIGEHPEENTPRLMYADWIKERGRERTRPAGFRPAGRVVGSPSG